MPALHGTPCGQPLSTDPDPDSALDCGLLPLSLRRRQLLLAGAAAMTLVLAGCASGGDLSSSSLFELRGATTVPTSGWLKVPHPQTAGGDLYLAPRAALDASDVQRATAQRDAIGRGVLVLQFTPVGTARLVAASRELQGRQLAAVLEGRVTSVISVQGNMSINTMALTGLASFDDAVRLAHLLWPRQ